MSYYDIDAILTDAQKVPCTFELDVPGLGFVDGNAGGDVRQDDATSLSFQFIFSTVSELTTPQIKRGMRTTLPLWLGELLAVQRLGNSAIVNLDLPETLSPRVLNALKADPKSVDMRALAQHFYGLAARVLDLFEEEEIVDILTEVGQSTGAS